MWGLLSERPSCFVRIFSHSPEKGMVPDGCVFWKLEYINFKKKLKAFKYENFLNKLLTNKTGWYII